MWSSLFECSISLCLVVAVHFVEFFLLFCFVMIQRPPRSPPLYSSAASDVYKRQLSINPTRKLQGFVIIKTSVDSLPTLHRRIICCLNLGQVTTTRPLPVLAIVFSVGGALCPVTPPTGLISSVTLIVLICYEQHIQIPAKTGTFASTVET